METEWPWNEATISRWLQHSYMCRSSTLLCLRRVWCADSHKVVLQTVHTIHVALCAKHVAVASRTLPYHAMQWLLLAPVAHHTVDSACKKKNSSRYTNLTDSSLVLSFSCINFSCARNERKLKTVNRVSPNSLVSRLHTTMLTMSVQQHYSYLASFPVPRPAFRRLQYSKRTASDEKLGVGLGTRLIATWVILQHEVYMKLTCFLWPAV